MNGRFRYSARTHIGHSREVNEDAILALPESNIWVVSDGMGGHASGDYASRMICDIIARIAPGLEPSHRLRFLRRMVRQAHETIRGESEARGGVTIGATIVALLLAERHFVGLWAGDSRLYRLRDGEIEMLTADHSIAGALVASGRLSWDETENHPQANVITRAIGVGEWVELDKVHGEIRPSDRYLLCSDGLSRYASFEMLRRALAERSIETVADHLVKIALSGGGADNISVIVVDAI